MKLLHVIPFFSPLRGGSVTVACDLSKELARDGHEVTIATTDFELDKNYANSIEGVNVLPFRCLSNVGLFLYSREFKKWLMKNIDDFDVIHLHNFRSYQNNVVCSFAIGHNIPYILQAHGSLPRIGKTSIKILYDTIWGNSILHHASGLIALTQTELDQYQQMGIDREKIEIIPNGINLSGYGNLPEKGSFKTKYQINEHDRIILFLGRIHPIKGIDLLIHAFNDLLSVLYNVKLVIVGPDDGYLPYLKKLISGYNIEDKIIFTGPLYNRDKLAAFIDADVYVLPSYYETFPMTVLEACACGTPVIITDRCGIAEIVEHNIGYVVKCNKNQLKDKIYEILNDEEVRIMFKENALITIRKRFNLQICIKSLEKMYEDVVVTHN